MAGYIVNNSFNNQSVSRSWLETLPSLLTIEPIKAVNIS